MGSDNLYQLIHSLGKAEKRYFKRFSNLHVKGRQNKYVKLFDHLEQQKVYDEAAVIRELRDKKFTGNFSQAKAALYKLILKSLRNFHHQSMVEINFNDQLSDIHILFKKKLFGQAKEIVDRLYQSDYAADKPLKIMGLNNLDFTLAVKSNDIGLIQNMRDTFWKDQKQLLAKMEVNSRNRHLYISIYDMFRSIGVLNTKEQYEKAEKLIKELDEVAKNDISPYHLRLNLQAHFFYHYMVHNRVKAIQEAGQLVDMMQEQRFDSVLGINDFLISKGNLLQMLPPSEKRSKKVFDEIRKIVLENGTSLYADNLCRSASSMMEKLLSLGQITQAKKFLNENEHLLLYRNIDEPARLSFMSTAIWINIFSKSLNKAQDYVNYFINEVHTRNASDFYIVGKISDLVVMYEKKNFSLLKPIGESAIRKLKKIKRLDDSLHTFFLHFVKNSRKPGKQFQDELTFFRNLKSSLFAIKNRDQLIFFKDVNWCAWIESKVRGNSIELILKSKSFKKEWGF